MKDESEKTTDDGKALSYSSFILHPSSFLENLWDRLMKGHVVRRMLS